MRQALQKGLEVKVTGHFSRSEPYAVADPVTTEVDTVDRRDSPLPCYRSGGGSETARTTSPSRHSSVRDACTSRAFRHGVREGEIRLPVHGADLLRPHHLDTVVGRSRRGRDLPIAQVAHRRNAAHTSWRVDEFPSRQRPNPFTSSIISAVRDI